MINNGTIYGTWTVAESEETRLQLHREYINGDVRVLEVVHIYKSGEEYAITGQHLLESDLTIINQVITDLKGGNYDK